MLWELSSEAVVFPSHAPIGDIAKKYLFVGSCRGVLRCFFFGIYLFAERARTREHADGVGMDPRCGGEASGDALFFYRELIRLPVSLFSSRINSLGTYVREGEAVAMAAGGSTGDNRRDSDWYDWGSFVLMCGR